MSYKTIDKWVTPNRWSRPQSRVNNIKGIVIHWIAAPNGSAKGVFNFFEGRKNGNSGFGSAHETIDLNGDVWRMIPSNEVAYHVGAKSYKRDALNRLSSYPNNCTYGIECTHLDWNGKMSDTVYNVLVERCVDLCKEWNLTENDLWLHYEVTGKDCHKWFVNNPDEWKKFKKLVGERLKGKNRSSQQNTIQGDDDKLNLTGYQWGELEKNVEELLKEGVITSPNWVDKCKKKSLTLSELAWLNNMVLQRLRK